MSDDITPGRPDLAIAAALGSQQAHPNRVSVDLSTFRTNRVVVDYDDFDHVPSIGDLVVACDLLEHAEATAEVLGINERECTAALAVDWDSKRQVAP